MNKKDKGELSLSLLFALFGLGAVVGILHQEGGGLSNTSSTNFRTLPVFSGVLLILFSLMNAAGLWRKWRRETKTQECETRDKIPEQESKLRLWIFYLLCVGFALLLKNMMFAVLVFLFLLSAFRVLGQKRMHVNILVALAGSGMIHLIFIVLLKLPL